MNTNTLGILRSKAIATAMAIKDFDSKERSQNPSARMGSDYNALVAQIESISPELGDQLPPLVDLFTSATTGVEYASGTYSELMVFCKQISEILGVVIDK